MKQKQSFCLYLLLLSTCLVQALDDHFVSTTGNTVVESKNDDITILADTGGSTGKVNLQAGTTTSGTTTAGDIGLSATNELILKATTKIMLDAAVREDTTGALYSSAVTLNGSFDGNLTVTNDLTVSGFLQVYGDLIVRGGSVTIGIGSKLIVSGDIIFDGLQTAGKHVNIAGSIYGATSNDPGCQKLTIRNYKPETDVDPVSIEGIVTANGDVLITNNETFAGTKHTAVTIGGTFTAYGTITFSHNIGKVTDGTITGYGVRIDGPLLESYTGDILFINNEAQGGIIHGVVCGDISIAVVVRAQRDIIFKSNSTTSTTGHGVSIEWADDVIAGRDMRFEDNNAGNFGNGVNIQIASTLVEAGRDIYFKNNTSTSGAKVYIHTGTTVTGAHQVIFDEATTLSTTGLLKSGTINGEVVFNGGLTASFATTFEGDIVVVDGNLTMNENITCKSCFVNIGNLTVASSKLLRAEGDLTVYGSVDVGSSARLHVDDNIFFDGQKDGTSIVNNIRILGDIHGGTTADPGARNITMQNYYNNVSGFCAPFFGGTSNVTVLKDIIMQNNSAAAPAGDAICLVGTGKVFSLAGDIVFYNNSTSSFSGVAITQDMEADRIIFTENSSSGTGAISNRGVSVYNSPTLTGRREIRVERNIATGIGNAGADFVTATLSTTSYFKHHHSLTTGKRITNDSVSAYFNVGGGPTTYTRDVNDF